MTQGPSQRKSDVGRNLKGSRILVTGASRGIGRRVALLLAAKGAALALTARTLDELEETGRLVRGLGAVAVCIPADLTNPDDRARLVDRAAAELGGLDILINNAGVASFGEFADSSERVLRTLMEINFFAPIEMIRLCLPHLAKSNNEPAVLNVASICARRGIPSYPEHCASKHAVAGMTECFRGEFARFGIDALLLIPGVVKTDNMVSHLLRNEGKIYINPKKAISGESVAEGIVRAIERNRTESVVGWMAWFIWRGQRLMPWFLDIILARKVAAWVEKHGDKGKAL